MWYYLRCDQWTILTIRKFPEQPITIQTLIEIGLDNTRGGRIPKKSCYSRIQHIYKWRYRQRKDYLLKRTVMLHSGDGTFDHRRGFCGAADTGIANLVRLEAREANLEGKNAVSIRDLLRSALRMRPDRIILGEVRDAAACELLTAMNTGHDGSLSTGHANSPQDMLNRLETLVLMGMDIPLEAVRSQIASAIDIVVQLGRLRDRSRKVLTIAEVSGMQEGHIVLRDIFQFQERGEAEVGTVVGNLQWTGAKLSQTTKLELAGVKVPCG